MKFPPNIKQVLIYETQKIFIISFVAMCSMSLNADSQSNGNINYTKEEKDLNKELTDARSKMILQISISTYI
jgi:hypothetical protein